MEGSNVFLLDSNLELNMWIFPHVLCCCSFAAACWNHAGDGMYDYGIVARDASGAIFELTLCHHGQLAVEVIEAMVVKEV
uniref:Uncharacterized protein n=1 Tax=Cannabis sativa TaxID=3483 RepID=A0A803PV14_CANSA